ncbi:MAG: hypothetical protein HYS87_01310 [Candidatus Colwellbacteria bacterium]|nr:hypothetical protein [Candidatus Colwellbacteria bacterium]
MIIFIYGPNSYLRGKRLKETLSSASKKQGTSLFLEQFNVLEDKEFERLLNFVGSRSMFEPRKFAVVENILESENKKEVKEFLKENIGDKETILIVLADKKPAKTFDFLLADDVVQRFCDLPSKGPELRAFIKREAVERGLQLGAEDTEILEENFGEDLWGIVTELDKVALMKKPTLESAQLGSYFALSGALKYGGTPTQKLTALEKLFSDNKEDPARIFNGLIFGLKDRSKIEALADYDAAVKSGKLDYEEALVDFALS